VGGLGTFNGTLVDGPVWTADGVDFDGSNDRITLPNGSFGTGDSATSIWAFLKNETIGTRMTALSTGNLNISTDGPSLESPADGISDSSNMAFTATPNSFPASTDWKSLFLGNTSLGFSGKNGGTVTQYTLNNTLNKSGASSSIGAMGDPQGFYFDGLMAVVIRIDATPTTTLNSQIYSLYKSTLGTGITFP
jgi:hypothetical protein